MTKFNYDDKEDRANAIKRALLLKPRTAGVYATSNGYVVDRPNGSTELLVSFHNLKELLEDAESSPTEFVPEVTIVAETSPVETVVQVVAEVAKVEDETEEVQAVVETKEERKARRAAEKAAKAAE